MSQINQTPQDKILKGENRDLTEIWNILNCRKSCL